MTNTQSLWARRLLHTAALGVCAVWGMGEAHAATINVTTTSMSASPSGCGFREALQALNNQVATGGCAGGNGVNDIINLPAGTYTSTVTLSVARSVEIRGAGVSQTVVRSNLSSGDTFIHVDTGPLEFNSVVFQDLTLSRASTQTAPQVTGLYATAFQVDRSLGVTLRRTRVTSHTWGGVYSDGAHISIEDSTIESNSSPWSGGGVSVNNTSVQIASTNIYHSTINNNTSQACGGGIYHGAQGNSHLDFSTVSGNAASGSGGGLCLNAATDYFQIDDSTIAFNSASNAGGGISSGGLGNYYVFNTIVASNNAHAVIDWDGYVTHLENSLVGESGVSILSDGGNNLFDVFANLDSTLRSLGGPTKVHRLLSGSPAIDHFTFDPMPSGYVDQRYLPKCVNGDGVVSSTECDIGAAERQP
jgi:hypothetical protein